MDNRDPDVSKDGSAVTWAKFGVSGTGCDVYVVRRTAGTCTVVEGTQVDCTGTLQLRDGTIAVKGTPDLAVTPIDMVVTGGTGRYATVTGSAQLTPTDRQGTSRLTVYLERPAS